MNKISRPFAGFVLGAMICLAGCELTTPFAALNLDEIDPIIYTQHVQPILDAKCTRCHSGPDAARGLRLDNWQNLIAGSDFGQAVVAYDDENSLLIGISSLLVGGPHPHELASDTLTAMEVRFLRRWIDNGAEFDDGSIPYADADQLLYVPNQDDALISIIDVESKLVIRTVDLVDVLNTNFTPNARPHHVAVETTGDNWYVSLIGDNKVVKFSRDNTYLGQADFETPGLVAVNPQTDQLFVGRSLSAVSPPSSIGVVTRSTMEIRELDVLYQRPHALVVDPSGEYVHTGSLAENRIMTVDTGSDDVTFTLVSAPFHAFVQFALSPDGDRLVATGQQSNQVVIMDTSSPPGIGRIGAIEVGSQPWHPVWTPDAKTVYVGNLLDNTVSVLNMDNFTVTQTIEGEGLAEPHGSAVSPDGKYVFISNRNTSGTYQPRYDLGNNQNKGTVVVINTATNEIEKIIEVGRYPAGLSIIQP